MGERAIFFMPKLSVQVRVSSSRLMPRHSKVDKYVSMFKIPTQEFDNNLDAIA